MKQKKWMWWAAAAVVFLAVLISCLTPPSIQKEISRALHLDVSAGTVLAQSESHGGFHGDGMTYAALRFEDDAVLRRIEKGSGWKALPLSENLAWLVRGLPTVSPLFPRCAMAITASWTARRTERTAMMIPMC